jgi:hypothetical protein
VLAWLAARLAHLLPPRPPGQGGTPPLSLEVRLDAVGAVLLDGLSYRRGGRAVGISKTEVGDSLDLLLGPLGALGFCQPDGTFIRGLAKGRDHWYAPVGDRRTIDRLSQEQGTCNRLQAGLRALVEQSIAHLANAWALRRWRGLLYRVRDVFRAASALICLGRWLHRVPT